MGSESSVPGYFLPAEEELRASALAQACARGGRIVKVSKRQSLHVMILLS
jgi:hypothetical protein